MTNAIPSHKPEARISHKQHSSVNFTVPPLAAQIMWSPRVFVCFCFCIFEGSFVALKPVLELGSPSFYPPIGVTHIAMWSPVRLSGKSSMQRQSLPYIQAHRPELTTEGLWFHFLSHLRSLWRACTYTWVKISPLEECWFSSQQLQLRLLCSLTRNSAIN